MAIAQYTITSTGWTAISTVGQSGTCWLDDDNELSGDPADVRIWHGTSAPSDADPTITDMARRVLRPKNNTDMLLITADGGTDVYYARCKDTGKTAKLSVDVSS